MKLKQKPTTMIAPTALGLWGLYLILAGHWSGLVLISITVIGWVMMLIVDPGPDAKQPNRLLLISVIVASAVIGFVMSGVTR